MASSNEDGPVEQRGPTKSEPCDRTTDRPSPENQTRPKKAGRHRARQRRRLGTEHGDLLKLTPWILRVAPELWERCEAPARSVLHTLTEATHQIIDVIMSLVSS